MEPSTEKVSVANLGYPLHNTPRNMQWGNIQQEEFILSFRGKITVQTTEFLKPCAIFRGKLYTFEKQLVFYCAIEKSWHD